MEIKDITLHNVTNAVQGTTNLVASRLHIRDEFKEEQFRYRAFLCLECVKNGRCVVCGCSSPGIFYAPNKQDSKNRWPTLKSESEWNSFKATDPTYQEYIKLLNSKNIELMSDIYFRKLLNISDAEYSSVFSRQSTVPRVSETGDIQFKAAA